MGILMKNSINYSNSLIEIKPEIYSLEEREVGVWIDGKPLYQKTFITTAYWEILQSNTWTPTGIILSDYDRLVSVEFSDETGKSIETSGMIAASNHELNLMSSRVSGYNAGVNISLKYTKTTDIPGSGIWTPSGIQTVHYDGNEKVIGTWFGETLYEKTINCGALPDNTSKSIAHNIVNLNIIVKSFGYAKAPVNQTPIPFVNNITVESQVALIIDSTNITLRTNDNRSAYTGYVTIQYTKTT